MFGLRRVMVKCVLVHTSAFVGDCVSVGESEDV